MAGAVPAFDPLADCLAAYLRLRFGSHVEQAGTITELAADTGLPDAILLDAYLSGQNDPRVIESAASQALNVGLPIFDLGMVAAVDTVNASNLRHPIADLVARRLPDQVITTISGETVPQLTDVRSPALVGV